MTVGSLQEPLAKQVKAALQEGDRFKLKSHSWDLEVIHIYLYTIFLSVLKLSSFQPANPSICSPSNHIPGISRYSLFHSVLNLSFPQPVNPPTWQPCISIHLINTSCQYTEPFFLRPFKLPLHPSLCQLSLSFLTLPSLSIPIISIHQSTASYATRDATSIQHSSRRCEIRCIAENDECRGRTSTSGSGDSEWCRCDNTHRLTDNTSHLQLSWQSHPYHYRDTHDTPCAIHYMTSIPLPWQHLTNTSCCIITHP